MTNLFQGYREREIRQLLTSIEGIKTDLFHFSMQPDFLQSFAVIEREVVYHGSIIGNVDRGEVEAGFESTFTDSDNFSVFLVPGHIFRYYDVATVLIIAMGHDSIAVAVQIVIDAIHFKVVGITCHGNYRQ